MCSLNGGQEVVGLYAVGVLLRSKCRLFDSGDVAANRELGAAGDIEEEEQLALPDKGANSRGGDLCRALVESAD